MTDKNRARNFGPILVFVAQIAWIPLLPLIIGPDKLFDLRVLPAYAVLLPALVIFCFPVVLGACIAWWFDIESLAHLARRCYEGTIFFTITSAMIALVNFVNWFFQSR